MAQFIYKDALVAEIEKQQRRLCILGQSNEVELRKNVAIQNGVYYSLLSFLDTLEMKEVDLEKEIDNVWNPHFNLGWDNNSLVSINHKSFESIAKHFFELGLKTKVE